MTEIYETSQPKGQSLPIEVERFILHWGEMGGQWGVNRSVAQIQALLFLSEQPLNAEEIAEKLSLARSNVSNSIKELLAWKLIHRVPVFGDRRDFYAAETDLWQMATKITQGRKEREIDPMVASINEIMAGLKKDENKVSPIVKQRLTAMHQFVTQIDTWYSQMLSVPPEVLMKLISLGSKIVNLVGFTTKKEK